jgi:tetratricopeptide (TPR) repeat protein
LAPDFEKAFIVRALLHIDRGDIDSAITDIERIAGADKNASGGYLAWRGTIRHIKGDLHGAIADYRAAEERAPTTTRDPPGVTADYADMPAFGSFDPLLLFLALVEAGRAEEGQAALRKMLEQWPTEKWPAPLAHYLIGESSEAALRKAAEDGTEVLRKYQDFDRHFYLGAMAALKGDKIEARTYLEHVLSSNMRQVPEYGLAHKFLERLDKPASVDSN